jgi:uncharacterized membrane protein
MNDKIIRAFIAGLIGGAIKDILDLISYYCCRFTNYRYLDFTAMIIYGKKPFFWWDTVFVQFIELIFSGLIGIIFTAVIPRESNRNYLIKGWLYGVAVWLFLCIIGMIFKTPFFTLIPWQTANSDFLTSSVYGIVLALTLRYFDKKYDNHNELK